MKKVIVIVGPTASGKTLRGINLAKKLNTEIINGDSVQIYKELNIGSAKVQDQEMQGIKHHLLNVKNVGEPYSAFDFQSDVRALIKTIDIPLIVGGTGFYIKSALYNYEFDEFSNSKTYNDLSNEQIYQLVKDSDSNINIDINNRIRLIRALNMLELGIKPSSKIKKDQALYDILTIYLDYPRSGLKTLLSLRLDKMLDDGFIEEVKSINSELNIIGYRELYKYLNGEIDLDEAKELIINASMRLAKKQKTWFKNQMDCVMLDAKATNIDELVYNEVLKFLGDKR